MKKAAITLPELPENTPFEVWHIIPETGRLLHIAKCKDKSSLISLLNDLIILDADIVPAFDDVHIYKIDCNVSEFIFKNNELIENILK